MAGTQTQDQGIKLVAKGDKEYVVVSRLPGCFSMCCTIVIVSIAALAPCSYMLAALEHKQPISSLDVNLTRMSLRQYPRISVGFIGKFAEFDLQVRQGSDCKVWCCIVDTAWSSDDGVYVRKFIYRSNHAPADTSGLRVFPVESGGSIDISNTKVQARVAGPS
jgi:hypothetical protein